MSKTDYLGIHERAYKRIIDEGRSGWSDNAESRCLIRRGIAGRYYGKVKDILKETEKVDFFNCRKNKVLSQYCV